MGDNLPHDQIRCQVTEAKINTVLITNAICKRQKTNVFKADSTESTLMTYI
jgi:hypothetical protein